MNKIILKFFIAITTLSILIIIYLSVIGLETDKFNNQMKDKLTKTNKNLEIKLKKITSILSKTLII